MEKMNGFVRFSNEEVLMCKTDEKMLNMLVENCEGVIKEALKGIHLPSHYTYDDKMQIGYIGLLKAVKNFDIERGADFYSYAHICIRSELYNEHRGMKRAKRGYNEENDSFITVGSLDVQVDDEEGMTLGATIVDTTMNTYEQAFDITEGLEKIEKILSEGQRIVFVEHFLREKSLKEVAKEQGYSTTRAGNLAKQVREKIMKNFSKEEFVEIIRL